MYCRDLMFFLFFIMLKQWVHPIFLLSSMGPFFGLSLSLFCGTIRHILFLSIRTGSPSENWLPPKGCLYLPSILAGSYHSLSACHHSWCQVLTDASSFPLSSASHFSVFLIFFIFIFPYLPRTGTLWRRMFVLQPGSQLFSGSAVLFSLPLFSLNTPGKSGCVSDIVFVLLTIFLLLL